jgi:hypothetical protein
VRGPISGRLQLPRQDSDEELFGAISATLNGDEQSEIQKEKQASRSADIKLERVYSGFHDYL